MDCVDQACVSGACSGVCDPEEERCSSNTPQECSDTGAWGNKSAQCASPDNICKVVSSVASCVANPPYYVGEETPLGTNAVLAAGFLFAVPITFDFKTRVLDFGMVGRTANGAFVTMALYTNNGGVPGTLIGSSTEKQIAVGQNNMSPVSALIQQPGNYWLVGIFSANATSYEQASAGAVYRYASGSYATFPATFPASTQVSGTLENFYVRVQDQP
jgi:hypothetical protein